MTEWDVLLLQGDSVQMLGGFLDTHTCDGLGGLVSVRKANTKIQTSWFARCWGGVSQVK